MPTAISVPQKEKAAHFGVPLLTRDKKKVEGRAIAGESYKIYQTSNGEAVKLHRDEHGFGKMLKYGRLIVNADLDKVKGLAPFKGLAKLGSSWGLAFKWIDGTPANRWKYDTHEPTDLAKILCDVGNAAFELSNAKIAPLHLHPHDVLVMENGDAKIVHYEMKAKTKTWGKIAAKQMFASFAYQLLTGVEKPATMIKYDAKKKIVEEKHYGLSKSELNQVEDMAANGDSKREKKFAKMILKAMEPKNNWKSVLSACEKL